MYAGLGFGVNFNNQLCQNTLSRRERDPEIGFWVGDSIWPADKCPEILQRSNIDADPAQLSGLNDSSVRCAKTGHIDCKDKKS